MKKLYMLAAGALCAAMASAANGDVTDGWLMLEDFEGTAPAVSIINVDNGSEGQGTLEIATVAKDGNDNNKVVKFTPGGYGQGVKLVATLPEGKTIADYTEFKIDLYCTNGKNDYKPFRLYIDGNKLFEANAVISGENVWKEFSKEIQVSGNGNEITLWLYSHASSSNTFVYDNIRLKEKEGGSGEDPDPVEPTEPDASTNGTVTDGVLMLEDFQGMALGTECIWHKGGNNDATGKVAADETKASNYVAELTTTNWDNYIEVNVTLPAGKTLKNYKNIIFDFYRYSGDDNYKKMLVYADDEEIYLDGNYIEQGKEKEWKRDKKYAIPATTNAGNSFKLRIGLNGTNKGHYAVDNIRLEERTEPIGTYDESKNGTVTNGWLMVEDYQNAEPGDAATLASPWGGEPVNGEAKIEADPANASNLVATYTATAETDKNYNTLFAVNVTLPEGKTLKDYEKVSFKMYRFDSGDDDYKQMLVKVGEEEIYKDVNAEGKDDYVHQADTKTWTVKEYDIAKTVTAGNSFKLIFGVKTENAHYAVDEIRLLERAASVVELDGEPSISISHDTAAGEMTVSYSFNVTGYAGEEIKVVANVDGHEEVIFEEYVPEAGNAPMRAAAENRTFSGSLKATHEVLKALANPDVKVSATADDKELFAVTKAPDSTTGITGITADSETEAEYFNLQGIRIANPEPGQLYIRRQGSKAVKIRF